MVEGIQSANEKLKNKKASITYGYVRTSNPNVAKDKEERNVTLIDFDIAVTVNEKGTSGVDGGIQVFSLKAGGKKETENLNETVSKIKFTLAMKMDTNENTGYGEYSISG